MSFAYYNILNNSNNSNNLNISFNSFNSKNLNNSFNSDIDIIWQHMDKCSICNNQYSLFDREHHCRKCRRSVCNKCSNYKGYIGYETKKLQRICLCCYDTPSNNFILICENNTIHCNICRNKFTFTKRRHHCRNCGKNVCHKCSSIKQIISGFKNPQRICNNCYNYLII
jgi:hypothetical protein